MSAFAGMIIVRLEFTGMSMTRILAGLLMSVAFCGAAQAESLKLAGKKHWLAVYSTQNLDAAIGIARGLYVDAKVVASKSSFYGVVIGPYTGNSIAEVKRRNTDISDLPKDAFLADGTAFTSVAWSQPHQTTMVPYEMDKPAHLSSGDLAIEVKLNKITEDHYTTVVTGTEKNGPSFTFTTNTDNEFSTMGPETSLMKLDPALKVPQLVFTRYSGGAHCCTNTWIASKPNGGEAWSLIDAGRTDGSGFGYEDVDGDGGLEMLKVDNAFLYAFDSYAGSFAPVKIFKLRGGKLEDVSEEPAFRPRLVQDLASMEYSAKVNNYLWKSNGFLVGWAASKFRLGQSEDAWQVLTENVQKDSSFGPQECSTGQSVADCAGDNLKFIPVMKAIASFLKEEGYGPLPSGAEVLLK
jgi:serine protease Do